MKGFIMWLLVFVVAFIGFKNIGFGNVNERASGVILIGLALFLAPLIAVGIKKH